MRLSLLNLYTE